MKLRLLEVYLPDALSGDLDRALEDLEVEGVWRDPSVEGRIHTRILVRQGRTEAVLDRLEARFSAADLRIIVLPVEASIPRPEEPEEQPKAEADKVRPKERQRISREELLGDLADGTKVSPVFIVLVVLSAIVAAVGLMQNNVAVIIGAMVIAPLLTPNMALALATTLGDLKMMRKALRTNGVGVGLALLFALTMGAFLDVDPRVREIASRTTVSLVDLVLALASGSAGALSFTSGVSAGLVGVMVAVALMPPLVCGGLLLAAGEPAKAGGAFLLLAANVICVNLAAVVTFLIQGLHPRRWWEADRARRAVRTAVALWTALLAVLVVILVLRG